jgi:hypothetical protein
MEVLCRLSYSGVSFGAGHDTESPS